MAQIFKRLGHLGEVHLIDDDGMNTFCKIRADGPNFSEVGAVDLAPRPDPTLCVDCKAENDVRNPPAEKPKKAAPKKAAPKKAAKKEVTEEAEKPKEDKEEAPKKAAKKEPVEEPESTEDA